MLATTQVRASPLDGGVSPRRTKKHLPDAHVAIARKVMLMRSPALTVLGMACSQ